MTRAGITFDTGQRATIKHLVDTGHLLAAQKVILGQVETSVGGSAKAYGATFPGALARSEGAMRVFARTAVDDLVPAMQILAGTATFFASHKTAREAAEWAIGISGGLLIASKAVKTYEEISALGRRVPARVAANAALAASP